MKKILSITLLLLFIIVLCIFLGNTMKPVMYEGFEDNAKQLTYYGPNNSIAIVNVDTNGNKTITINKNNETITYSSSNVTSNTYYAPNGSTATFTTTELGFTKLEVTEPDGKTVTVYQLNEPNTTNTTNTTNISDYTKYDNYNHFEKDSMPFIFYGPNGEIARLVKNGDGNTVVVTYKNGNTEIYYIDKPDAPTANIYYGPNGSYAKIINDSNNNKTIELTKQDGNKIILTKNNIYTFDNIEEKIDNNCPVSSYNKKYYETLPDGIPSSQIPRGDEDLYILKSQIVPPVCPKCPNPILQCPDLNKNIDLNKCPPCPACERCPEPNVECVKVQKYSPYNPETMPVPIFSNYSTFGM